MFLTGYDTHDLLRESAAVPTLAKPAGEPELVATVGALVVGGTRQNDLDEGTVRIV
jgi:hypothetical protein